MEIAEILEKDRNCCFVFKLYQVIPEIVYVDCLRLILGLDLKVI